MGKGSRSASHQLFKDKAKNRVDDLQGMFTDIQFARKESRTGDVAVLEEQVHQMLREWKAELNEASPASSLHGGSRVSSDLSSDIRRLLQLCEEEDDATSKLAELPNPKLEPEPDVVQNNVQGLQAVNNVQNPQHVDNVQNLQGANNVQNLQGAEALVYQEGYYTNNHEIQIHDYQGIDGCKTSLPMELLHQGAGNCMEGPTQLDYQQFNMHQDVSHNMFPQFVSGGQHVDALAPNFSDLLPTICPPASAFLRPKCALWDCPRPAKGADSFEDYCSSVHAILAWNEGPPGMTPVLRPGGIDLKDGPLFAALTAKTQGKNVGIPECEGAATTKSPWNASELFDLSVLEGESLREWLFFDKPRRAFESGNRKQRSLPDYSGRGWHESRKQVMKEFGGLKRSYYMDPQPLNNFEWHLYEYEINNCDACALYRLELKLMDGKKNGKGKVTGVSLVDLQRQMGKLTSDGSVDNKRSAKGRGKVNAKDTGSSIPQPMPIGYMKDNSGNAGFTPEQVAAANENLVYGPHLPYGYSVDGPNHYYGT